MCDQCNKDVYDTDLLNDIELQHLFNNQPHFCLKDDLNQENLTTTILFN
ncbi:MAG: hypothetical protein JWR05_1402 [Mucilaginibacter sp.]|nr:hypothetical protein [Mucilaginibacter sp.]